MTVSGNIISKKSANSFLEPHSRVRRWPRWIEHGIWATFRPEKEEEEEERWEWAFLSKEHSREYFPEQHAWETGSQEYRREHSRG